MSTVNAKRVILKNRAGEYIVPEVAKVSEAIEGNMDPITSDAVFKELQSIGRRYLGEIFAYPGAVPPEGAYSLNGQTITGCNELYPKFWEWVQSAGVRIIDNDTYEAELASAGVCDGFVINSATGSVRLPKWHYQSPLGETLPVRGNGMSLGLTTDPASSVGYGFAKTPNDYFAVYSGYYGRNLPHSGDAGSESPSNSAFGITTDPDKSGIVAENNAPTDHFVLCIQVFNAATTLSEQESAQLASLMQTKAQLNLANVDSNIDYVVESWNDVAGGWYRKYRSGWVEQGGVVEVGAKSKDFSVALFVEYSNTNYNVLPYVLLVDKTGDNRGDSSASAYGYTETGFSMTAYSETDTINTVGWEAKGYAATE